MGKIFAVLLIVLGIWFGVEVFNNGMGGAFGGLFTRLGWVETTEEEPQGTAGRAAGAVDRAYRAGENRVERQLGD